MCFYHLTSTRVCEVSTLCLQSQSSLHSSRHIMYSPKTGALWTNHVVTLVQFLELVFTS